VDVAVTAAAGFSSISLFRQPAPSVSRERARNRLHDFMDFLLYQQMPMQAWSRK